MNDQLFNWWTICYCYAFWLFNLGLKIKMIIYDDVYFDFPISIFRFHLHAHQVRQLKEPIFMSLESPNRWLNKSSRLYLLHLDALLHQGFYVITSQVRCWYDEWVMNEIVIKSIFILLLLWFIIIQRPSAWFTRNWKTLN